MIPLVITLVGMCMLVVINRRVGGHLVYPPAAFALAWLGYLALLFLAQNMFYPLSVAGASAYLLGAICFSVGGVLALRVSTNKAAPTRWPELMAERYDRTTKVMAILAVVLLCCMPFYWRYVSSLGAGHENFWYGVRIESLNPEQESAGVLANVVSLSATLALVAFWELDKTPKRRAIFLLALAMTLVLNLLTAGRAGFASLALGLVGIHWVKVRRLPVKALFWGGILFLVFFFGIALLVGKGGVDPNASLSENIPDLFEDLMHYALGGAVAFDQLVQDPGLVPPAWNPFRVVLLTLNKFGASFEVPSLHANFIYIGGNKTTNVYTMYFSYFPEYGWPGLIAFPTFLGFVSTLIWKAAMRGNSHAVVQFGMVFAAIFLSGFNEGFFLSINPILKALIFTSVLYGMPVRLRWNPRPRSRLTQAYP